MQNPAPARAGPSQFIFRTGLRPNILSSDPSGAAQDQLSPMPSPHTRERRMPEPNLAPQAPCELHGTVLRLAPTAWTETLTDRRPPVPHTEALEGGNSFHQDCPEFASTTRVPRNMAVDLSPYTSKTRARQGKEDSVALRRPSARQSDCNFWTDALPAGGEPPRARHAGLFVGKGLSLQPSAT